MHIIERTSRPGSPVPGRLAAGSGPVAMQSLMTGALCPPRPNPRQRPARRSQHDVVNHLHTARFANEAL